MSGPRNATLSVSLICHRVLLVALPTPWFIRFTWWRRLNSFFLRRIAKENGLI